MKRLYLFFAVFALLLPLFNAQWSCAYSFSGCSGKRENDGAVPQDLPFKRFLDRRFERLRQDAVRSAPLKDTLLEE